MENLFDWIMSKLGLMWLRLGISTLVIVAVAWMTSNKVSDEASARYFQNLWVLAGFIISLLITGLALLHIICKSAAKRVAKMGEIMPPCVLALIFFSVIVGLGWGSNALQRWPTIVFHILAVGISAYIWHLDYSLQKSENFPKIKEDWDAVRIFDVVILFGVSLVAFLSLYVESIHGNFVAAGFAGGATAFQLLVANVLFNPNYYDLVEDPPPNPAQSKQPQPSGTGTTVSRQSLMAKLSEIKIRLLILAVLLVAGIGLYFLLFHQSEKHKSKLAIGIGTWPGFAVGMVGMEKGLFAGIELDHRVLDDAPARHAAYQSGTIDIMVSSLDVFAQEAAQGIKGRIFLVTDESFGGDGIVAKRGIKTPAELKGKKVAFARATPSHFLLYKVLRKHGLSPADIKQVKVDDPGQAAQAFLGGSVDAAVTWEPFLTEVKEKGKGHVLVTTRNFPGIIVDVLVASEKLNQNQNLLRQFMNSWLQSVEYIKQHPEESSQIIAKGLKTKSKDVGGMMAGLRFADASLNAEYFSGKGPLQAKLPNILTEAADFWKSQSIINEIPAVNNLISKTALEFFSEDHKGK